MTEAHEPDTNFPGNFFRNRWYGLLLVWIAPGQWKDVCLWPSARYLPVFRQQYLVGDFDWVGANRFSDFIP